MKFQTALFLLLSCAAAAQQNAPRDRFAAIALEPVTPKRGGVAEKLPPVLPAIDLDATKNDQQLDFPRRHVLRTRAEFRAAVANLRKQYAPFLRDLTPPVAATRQSLDLDTFDFRMEQAEDRADITRVFRGEGAWTPVHIPDYRGPVGWWAGYYRKVLRVPEGVANQESQFLRFNAVDYRCQVYLNGRMIGAHEGLFGPFEIDVTPYLRKSAPNVLVVRVENESTMLGLASWKGPDVDGDKIYAATGIGWNDPVLGWHECPPGAGIWQKVYLEGRPKVHISDIFVRPDRKDQSVEVRIGVYQPATINREVNLHVSIYSRNFPGVATANIPVPAMPAGPGFTEYRTRIRLGDFRRWDPDTPWLYTLRATIQPKDGGPADVRDAQFGMRQFEMDDTSPIKGTLYLNQEPIILRGANTMGNLLRPVAEGNTEQLIEDILIAKLAHLNFFRLTQCPVQPEVYDMCDRLGMMLQTDLPLFGYLRRPTLETAITQAGEMERLIRNHPSSILITYINEPFATVSHHKDHRDLTRPELEQFFAAASAVVHIYNPDRVIKTVDGDYDPPAPGIPDNHIYSMWYGSHAEPIGKFIRGYWVANKSGWKCGSGEYGVEGLDDADTMFRRYPKEWLAPSVDSPWSPIKIPFAQTATMHQGWFDDQDTMRQWVEASQQHQALGIRVMTRAFRRQSDRIESTAVHLLIDAWPACWLKSLVDVDRNPKSAYFELRDALTPLMADIRTDRTRYFSGEKLQLEFWVANDRRAPFPTGELLWEVRRGGERIFAQSAPARIPSLGAAFEGYFHYQAPVVRERERLMIRVGLKDPQGNLIHDSETEVEIFPTPDPARNRGLRIGIAGRQGGRAWKLAETLGAEPALFPAGADPAIVFVDSVEAYDVARAEVLQYARRGGTVLFLEQPPRSTWNLGDRTIQVLSTHPKEFVSRKTGHPLVASFQPFDFAYWYDPEKDYSEYTATSYVKGGNLAPILISGVEPAPGDQTAKPEPLIVAGEFHLGAGSLIFSQLKAVGRVQCEPPARAYFQAILDQRAKTGGGRRPLHGR